MMRLKEKLNLLPACPGVYLFRDAGGRIIYVGKADSLRERVRSYSSVSEGATARLRALAGSIEDFEYIACSSGVEALILECTLIKKHRPRYNVRFRDDKKYPYIKLTGDEYPGLYLTRTLRRDGSNYYGPFADASAARKTVRTLSRAFRLRKCGRRFKTRARPCLYYHISMCSGPCADMAAGEEYARNAEGARRFLAGRGKELLRDLEKRMSDASGRLDFEKAADLRDTIASLKTVLEKQNMEKTGAGDEDYISFSGSGSALAAGVLSVRGGKVIRVEVFPLDAPGGAAGPEILSAFIKQRYASPGEAPSAIMVPELPEDAALIEAWLGAAPRRGVRLHVPRRGRRRALMAKLDGNLSLKSAESDETARRASRREALIELGLLAGLSGPPEHIECFDAAHISGRWAVGAAVVFKEGFPARGAGRRFRVRARPGDDAAMLQEIVLRRYMRALSEGAALPELVVVDGGRAQVGAARAGLRAAGLHIPVIGLAKRRETVYLGDGTATVPDADSLCLSLLKHLRDEAHWGATSYHAKLRSGGVSASALDGVPGLGKAKKLALLREFGSVEGVASAPGERLMSVEGIGPTLARRISEVLNRG